MARAAQHRVHRAGRGAADVDLGAQLRVGHRRPVPAAAEAVELDPERPERPPGVALAPAGEGLEVVGEHQPLRAGEPGGRQERAADPGDQDARTPGELAEEPAETEAGRVAGEPLRARALLGAAHSSAGSVAASSAVTTASTSAQCSRASRR